MSSKLLIGMTFTAMLVGCAQVPLIGSSDKKADAGANAPCLNCNVKAPYYATAVTRPALCNDYPVEYRVQVPDSDARIRTIDRVVLGDGPTTMTNRACWK